MAFVSDNQNSWQLLDQERGLAVSDYLGRERKRRDCHFHKIDDKDAFLGGRFLWREMKESYSDDELAQHKLRDHKCCRIEISHAHQRDRIPMKIDGFSMAESIQIIEEYIELRNSQTYLKEFDSVNVEVHYKESTKRLIKIYTAIDDRDVIRNKTPLRQPLHPIILVCILILIVSGALYIMS